MSIDASLPGPLAPQRTTDELLDLLPMIEAAPKDVGTLTMVVRRPATGEREVLAVGHLDRATGLVGDNWGTRGSSRTPDGTSHPDMQLNVINHRVIEALSYADRSRQALAGDQLHIDLDLSHANLPPGSRLAFSDPGADGIPSAIIEVTEQPHTGCKKFVARYGPEAMKFVNGAVGRPLRLRGLNAKVVQPGPVRPGDRVTVTRPPRPDPADGHPVEHGDASGGHR